MWTNRRIAFLLGVAVLSAGRSRHSPEDRASISALREVNQTRTTVADVRVPSAVNLPAQDAGSTGIPLTGNPGAADADQPGSRSASKGENPALDLPFSSIPMSLTPEQSRELEQRGDFDDPEAPVIPVAPSPVAEQIAMLNNGRGDMAPPSAESPARSASEGLEEVALQPGSPSGPVAGVSVRGPLPSAQPTGADLTRPAAPGLDSNPPTPASHGSVADAKPGLAAEFGNLDKDGDGQIGLYEWPREKLAEFQQCDVNQDGFLTPAELTPAAE